MSRCFPPGTLVLTSNKGYIPIEKVRMHDMLLSHTGVFRSIVHCRASTYAGYIYYIYSTLGSYPIQCTEDLPFYAKTKSGNPEWVKAKDLTEYHFVGMPLETIYTECPHSNGCSTMKSALEHQRYLAHLGHLHGVYEVPGFGMDECECHAEAYIDGGYAWFKITEIEWSKEPAQTVYTFDVDVDTSYVVHNVAVLAS